VTREEYDTYVKKVIEEECKKGKHRFQDIFESGGDMEATVVRWCETCGSVVVDVDYDGRTKPGAVRTIVSPAITKALS